VANNLQELERILVCPKCHAPVRLVARKFWCTNEECRRSYSIDEHDIPHMLISEALIEDSAAPSGETVPAAPLSTAAPLEPRGESQ